MRSDVITPEYSPLQDHLESLSFKISFTTRALISVIAGLTPSIVQAANTVFKTVAVRSTCRVGLYLSTSFIVPVICTARCPSCTTLKHYNGCPIQQTRVLILKSSLGRKHH